MTDTPVLLLNPPYSDFFKTDHFNPSRPHENSTKMIPLGLAYLASYLRENSFKPLCIDLEVDRMKIKKLLKIIKTKSIRYVALTSTSHIIGKTIEIAREIKKNTDAITILGGAHASSEPVETASLGCFDIIVMGEGEETLLEIVQGKPLEKIRGIAYLKDGKIQLNKTREPIKNLDEIPYPAIDLFPYKEYKPSLHRNLNGTKNDEPYFAVISSRGCSFGCKFCSSHAVHGRQVRFRSVENMLGEIREISEKFKIKNIMFYDDTFTFNRKRTVKLCKGLNTDDIDISWGCNTRIDSVDAGTLGFMKSSGCKRVYVGIESGNNKILDIVNKGTNIDVIKKGIEKINNTGIEISASYIIGTPGDSRKTIKQTIEFACKNNTMFAHFYVFTPDPGSQFYNSLKAEGIIKPFDWMNYNEMIKKGTSLLGEKIEFKELIELTRNAYVAYYLFKQRQFS